VEDTQIWKRSVATWNHIRFGPATHVRHWHIYLTDGEGEPFAARRQVLLRYWLGVSARGVLVGSLLFVSGGQYVYRIGSTRRIRDGNEWEGM